MKPVSVLCLGCLAIALASLPARAMEPPGANPAAPVPVRLSDTLLTTLHFLEAGQPVAVTAFTTRDVPAFVTNLTWDNPAMSGGLHTVTWNWYNKGVLVSTSTHRNVEFKTSPHLLKTSRAASLLGPGPIRVDVLVDGKVLATTRFELKKG